MTAKKIVTIGERHNRLTIIDDAGYNKYRQRQLKVKCDCGKVTITHAATVYSGRTKSCGCLQKEKASANGKKNTGEKITNKDWRKGERDTPLTQKYPEDYGKCRGSYANKTMICMKRRALERSKEWTIDMLAAFELCISPCFYCGATCSWPESRNGIDRKDNSKGYIPDNCVSCCWTCNQAKNKQSLGEFKELVANLSKRSGGWQ